MTISNHNGDVEGVLPEHRKKPPPQELMADFDAMPKSIRQAVAEFPCDLDILKIKKFCETHPEYVNDLEADLRKKHTKLLAAGYMERGFDPEVIADLVIKIMHPVVYRKISN